MTLSADQAAWAHSGFAWAGMALGAAMWRATLRGQPTGGALAPGNFAVLVGLLLGAALGNKGVFLIERPDVALEMWRGQPVWPGQSIVGGLLGGLIGVEIAKKLTGQTRSTGDAMVWPIAVGLAIGRIGCFLAGLHDDTYGLPTSLSWGVDFGDGISRHPTQLYEIAVVLPLGWALSRSRFATPGLAFKLFLNAYLLWRFAVEFLKPVPVAYPLGLSGIQWTCLAALAVYLPLTRRATRQTA
ncbi:prolipoprotein diacylglyceryl transferase [Roseateles cellulosilyticus]|uniref:Prolipoprotein diacylglyceryl transferase n=1 Tax=Pelomonas cellulosilytica TaxID=2906762 RepID=A0ABS8XSU0_9BURK|nr:prolipoprotein diacylglyceryl transferase family protein [Pelomonas sp. P8]MCE4555784.1 prolipoprotein diacylglyceryl transferase [Pelomonas sp. P8]